MAVIMSKQLVVPEAPSKGTLASDLAEGGIVLIPESGVNVEFYVAKHDYESGLNGAGRTLFVRKDCYDKREWNREYSMGPGLNTYANSYIDTWFNGTYLSLLPSELQSLIGSTTFYYTRGGSQTTSNYTVTTLSRAVFALSVTEFGSSYGLANVEGSALPIASKLQIAYLSGTAVEQWTRSPNINTSTTDQKQLAAYISTYGSASIGYTTYTKGSRPCFTLPSNVLFDPDTKEFLGVA